MGCCVITLALNPHGIVGLLLERTGNQLGDDRCSPPWLSIIFVSLRRPIHGSRGEAVVNIAGQEDDRTRMLVGVERQFAGQRDEQPVEGDSRQFPGLVDIGVVLDDICEAVVPGGGPDRLYWWSVGRQQDRKSVV